MSLTQLQNELHTARELNLIYYNALTDIDHTLAACRTWEAPWRDAPRISLIRMLVHHSEDLRILESLNNNGGLTIDSIRLQVQTAQNLRSLPPRPTGRGCLRHGEEPIPTRLLAIRRLWAWLRTRKEEPRR